MAPLIEDEFTGYFYAVRVDLAEFAEQPGVSAQLPPNPGVTSRSGMLCHSLFG